MSARPRSNTLFFYPPEPGAEAINVFQEYIKARWPIITFALEPVTDQQNIEDAFTRRRDMQLAIAFALASGRLSFRQAINYTRQLQYEAQTIALNQTASAFAHGNDTFGWRFTPRYQTPPEESNFQAITNMLIRGGPGNNYQMDNSKLEPGLREQTAVVVMPSFVRGARLDIAGDWFRLHDPDERTIHTARTVELGRRINDTRQALEVACKFGNYRREDVERLYVRLRQLEAMLPLQTQFIKVPYENTLGGFALFTQGETALVPELTGFEGVEYLDPGQPCDLLVYGKHFSIYETAVVVGGVSLPREGTNTVVTRDASGNPIQAVTTIHASMRDEKGNLILIGVDGKPLSVAVKDSGGFDILSREVMRVRIPANCRLTVREDTQPVIELYVATPTGISNRLHIPVKPAPAPAPAPKPTGFGIPASPAYTFVDTNLTIPIAAHVVGTGRTAVLAFDRWGPFPPGTQVRIQPLVPNPPEAIDIKFVYPMEHLLLPVTLTKVPLSHNTNYVLEGKALDELANQLFKLINDNNLSFVRREPVTSRPVQIQATVQAGPIPATSTATNTLSVQFDVSLTPAPEVIVVPLPAAAAEGAGGAAPAPRAAPPAGTAPASGAAPAQEAAGGGKTAAVRYGTGPTMAASDADGARPIVPVGLARDPQAQQATINPGQSADLPPLPGGGAFAFQQPQTQPSMPAFKPPPSLSVPSLPPVGSGLATGLPTPAALPTLPATPALAAQGGLTIPPIANTSHTVVVMPPRAPSVNVSVPVTNMPPARQHHLFHRRRSTPPTTPSSPAASARGPLMERLLGRP